MQPDPIFSQWEMWCGLAVLVIIGYLFLQTPAK